MLRKNKNVRKMLEVILAVAVSVTAVLGVSLCVGNKSSAYADERADEGFAYLSDYSYVESLSYATKDPYFNTGENIVLNASAPMSSSTGQISLTVDGEGKKFPKGITACADSEVVYDVSALEFDWFCTYYGVDSSMSYADFWIEQNSARVKFYIYTSVDGVTWDLETEQEPDIKKGEDEASYVEIDIRGKSYIKLKAVRAGTEAGNHAVYANARLYKDDYIIDDTPYEFIKTVNQFDEILKNCSYDELLTTYESELLARKFVDYYGYSRIQDFAHIDSAHKQTIEWLLSDVEALRYFVVGGTPGDETVSNETINKTNALETLHALYTAYGADMQITEATQYTTLGSLYKRMIIGIALEFASPVVFNLYGGNYAKTDPIERYEIYKKLHTQGCLNNFYFETLDIAQMRMVVGTTLDNEEIEWLNWYVRVKMGGNMNCFAYMPYRAPSYQQGKFYSAANYAAWDAKYNLSEFGITYGNKNYPKLWMVYEQGSWCGGISQNGQYINQVLGIPSVLINQPTHGAYMYMIKNADGQCWWGIAYDLFGIHNSELSEQSLLKWGSRSWNSQSLSGGASYTFLAQHALNDYDAYLKAEETRILADVYTNYDFGSSEYYVPSGSNSDSAPKLKEIYEKVLEYQPIHLYGWYGLINAYKEDNNSTAEDFYNLAVRLTDTLYMHPYPIFELLGLIEQELKGTAFYPGFCNVMREGLKKGSIVGTAALPSDYLQAGLSNRIANRLLGQADTQFEVATFSFDGKNANVLALGSKFYGGGMLWQYSLDGGATWSAQLYQQSVTLTAEQVDSITSENDILIRMVGDTSGSVFTIDITKAVLPDDTSTAALFGNDLENRVVGTTDVYEWRYSADDEWTLYAVAAPDLSGNKSVEIRIGANAHCLPSESKTFTFTNDNQPDDRKYIPVSDISLHTVSSQATNQSGSAIYSIDGNYYTRWHSNWNGTDTQRYISFKFASPVFLKAVEFVPAGGGNGKILDGTVYGSLDGITWFKLSERKNLVYPNQCNTIADAIKYTQSFEIENPRDVLYVKIVADRASNGNWITARAFNFYEDTTQEHHPTASIIYSTTEPTTGNVTITLNNLFPDENITITNNGGSDTFVFTENGEFTFYFVNDMGVEGFATASVTWIDREPPTVDLEYSTDKPVRDKVVVILKPNEDITVLRDDIKYRIDGQGNVIDLEIENDPTIEDKTQAILNGYSVNEDGFVVDPLGKKIANINPLRFEFTENGTYTAEYVDRAGNKNSSEIVIDLIDGTLPVATLSYDYDSLTNEDVTVTISFNEEATLTNNGGSFNYTFTQNGSFTFEYIDGAGNAGSITATVDWIDKTVPQAVLSYDITEATNQNVTVTVSFDKDGVVVTNNGGSFTYTFTHNGSFTFEYIDGAGNAGSITATVDWIKVTPVIECDKSNKDVAVIKFSIPGQNITFVNGDGTFEFNQNGTYVIEYYDEGGNLCSAEVVVDWLEEKNSNTAVIAVAVVAGVVGVAVVCGVVAAVLIIKRKKKAM